MNKNPLFNCLTYIPPVILTKKEAQKELETEKIKRRHLHETNLEEWAKYKEETKEKIKQLNKILQYE